MILRNIWRSYRAFQEIREGSQYRPQDLRDHHQRRTSKGKKDDNIVEAEFRVLKEKEK